MTSPERLEQLEQMQELDELEASFGKNSDYPDGAVITWDQTYDKNGRTYTFVALKIGPAGEWYTTSIFQRVATTWDTLVEDHLRHAVDGAVYYVTEWTQA